MKRILKLELKKVFHSRLFLFSLAVGFCFVLVSVRSMYELNYGSLGEHIILALLERGETFELIMEGKSIYTGWIGAEINSPVCLSFFIVLPLLAMLPSGFSLVSEIKTGYAKHIIPKCGRKNYISAKLLSAFISGGCVSTIVQASSVALVALFLPAVAPRVIYNMYFPVHHGDLFSTLAYSKPMLFVICYLGVDFVFCGLFACLPVAAAFVVKKAVYAVLCPYLFIMTCSLLRSFTAYLSYVEVSPVYLLRAVTVANSSKWWVVLLWYAVFALIVIPFVAIKGVKYEIV